MLAQYLQVQWVEEENNVFAFILSEINFFEGTVYHSGSGEVWCWFVKSWHFCILWFLWKIKYIKLLIICDSPKCEWWNTQNNDRCEKISASIFDWIWKRKRKRHKINNNHVMRERGNLETSVRNFATLKQHANNASHSYDNWIVVVDRTRIEMKTFCWNLQWIRLNTIYSKKG